MPQITATQKTFLKAKPIASSQLAASEIVEIEQGRSLWVESISPAESGHAIVKLTFQGWRSAFIFSDHWTLNGKSLGMVESMSLVAPKNAIAKKKILDLPFCAQNDNENWSDGAAGNTQCNATSHTMLLLYLDKSFAAKSKANGFVEPESYFKSKLYAKGIGRGDHDGFTKVLREDFDIDSVWRYDLGRDDIRASIDAGMPLCAGLDFSSAGHIVCINGYEEKGVYLGDPYGERAGAASWYSFINPGWGNQRGKNEFYSWNLMDQVWSCGSGGWGRIIKSVAGKKTGL